jgi:phosphoribosylformimino-5-aminoimidazole carboxamide ribotide isomerase
MLKREHGGSGATGVAAIPAIDLLDGEVVRLQQGSYRKVTRFGPDPLEAAAGFAAQGATWLHLIDLTAARDGSRPREHARVIETLAGRADLHLQVGGGVRREAEVRELLELGVARVLVGTLAVSEPGLVGRLASETGAVAVAVDVRDDTVRAAGWLEDTGVPASEFVSRMAGCGVSDMLITAIERDGTGTGPDVGLIERLRSLVPGALVAAGGIATAAHVTAAVEAGADAVVLGRGLYEGTVTYAEASAASSVASASRRSSPTDNPS